MIRLLLVLLSSPAQAAERAIVFLAGPAANEPGAQERVAQSLASAGIGQVAWQDPEAVEADLQLVSVATRSEDALCGGEVSLREWSLSVQKAETRIQLLDIDGALAQLSMAELEAGCLDRPLDREILQRLDLALARAHLLSAQAGDPQQASFHEEQARQTISAMLALGDDLLLPSGLEPELQALVELRPYIEPIPVAGGGDLGEVLLDGVPIGRLPRGVLPGAHIVQVVHEGSVVAAARIELSGEPTLIWGGPLYPGDVLVEVQLIGSGQPASELFRALAGLLGEQVLVASVTRDEVRVHRLDGGLIGARPTPVQPPGPRVPTAGSASLREVERQLRGPFLIGASARLLTVPVGEGKDLPGWQTGLVVTGRYVLREDLRLAASVGYRGRRDLLPPAYTDTWLVQTMVPVQVGARYALERSVGVEAGADLLMGWSGLRNQGAGFRLGGVLALGLAVPLGDGLRLKLDGELAGGRAYVSTAAGLGIERSF